ncbi:DNA polymerase III subunit epsilon [Tolumonas lignilytica]|jgi:DNA polymerase III, epsilon subunit, Proteobacterial|uniref:DNA polymerase III subunit epsilon n=1 Tax=Tolumonas lignilytica TaxID=1283284 RepID=UPI0004663F87|nr:DNA polymerase III subunit epsilon [Tolumonas lignilytica]
MNPMQTNRQIVLDTETTGMNQSGGPHYIGHRIIEIGCVEVINRRLTGNHFHVYIKPDRLVDEEAFRVHGISDAFLADKPSFSSIAQEFRDFIQGAELVIHNASFDVGFMDYEFEKLGWSERTKDMCRVTDTLALARSQFPGKRNSLDALCTRFGIDNSHRTLHGALLDAEILADVYLLMTGGQTRLELHAGVNDNGSGSAVSGHQPKMLQRNGELRVICASAEELAAHEKRLDLVVKKGGSCLWRTEHE